MELRPTATLLTRPYSELWGYRCWLWGAPSLVQEASNGGPLKDGGQGGEGSL